MEPLRFDYRKILEIVEEGSRVLDLGCGDGSLLALLVEKKRVRGVGIEKDETLIYACVSKGLTVEHNDIDQGLQDFPDAFFDLVLLNFTLQETKHPSFVIHEALRVGRRAIVSFPNFAHYRARLYLGFTGKSPQTEALPHRWYETPNLHYFTIRDFREFCRVQGIRVDEFAGFSGHRKTPVLPNLFAERALFVVRKD